MAKSTFSLRSRKGNSPAFLNRAGGQWVVRVEDLDGTEVFSGTYASEQEALKVLFKLTGQLQRLREEHLGMNNPNLLKEEYRKAKKAADAIRDKFLAAKERMQSEEYRAARAAIKP